jgi:ubiquinone/menaquinone biosynthesis C-methylase UbiE
MPGNPMMPTTPKGIDLADENRRIRSVFKEREQAAIRNGSRNSSAYERRAILERNELLHRILAEQGIETLRGKKILDLGCGGGSLLRHLFDFGAQPGNCFGIDLVGERLDVAKHFSPDLGLVLGSGAQLPFPDSAFDITFQSLLFTSVLDPRIKQTIASEILRTMRKGGLLVWYDFIYNNPRNPNVRGVGRREIGELFPGCRLQFWRLTLAPPIGRVAVRVSPFLYQALAQLPFLRSHYLCLVEKTR